MEVTVFHPEVMDTIRLVKSEDLNHHGTLFAGRTAEWFVESGFIAATSRLDPKNVVCLRIHGMTFSLPARSGDVLKFTSKIVYTGRTSLTAYVTVNKRGDANQLVEGFITFIHVDESTKPAPHYLSVKPTGVEEEQLFRKACNLRTT